MSILARTAKTKGKVRISAGGKREPKLQNESFVNHLFIILISMFLIIVPFYRGLFFRENFIPSVIFITGIYILYILYKLIGAKEEISLNYMDIAVFMIPLAYFLSFLFSVNAKDAFDGFVKYAAYIALYFIISDLSKNKKGFGLIINGILLSVFVGAVAVIITASGILDLKGVILGNTIFGLYQYTNTTAAVLGTGLFLCFGYLMDSDKPYKAIYYQIAAVSMLSVFILTLSRGAYLAFAVLGVIYFIILGITQKLELFIDGIISLAASSLFVFGYYRHNTGNTLLLYFFFAIASASLLQWAYFRHIRGKLPEISKRYGKGIYIGIILIIAVVSYSALYREPIDTNIAPGGSRQIVIDNLKADTGYVLRYEVSAERQDSDNFGVYVLGHNKKYEYKELAKEIGITGTFPEKRELEFKTDKDTQVIHIYLNNTISENNITTYRNLEIYDTEGNLIRPLKQFKFIPRAIAERIENFSLKTGYNDARFVYIGDGLKIFGDYILFGAGGGGWKNLYRSYQSYPYKTTEAHSFYVQYAIETGIIGLLALAMVFVFIAKGFIKKIKFRDYLGISLYMGIFMTLLHASLDFNLSLAAPAYLLWGLVGCISTDVPELKIHRKNSRYFAIAAMVVSAFILFNCLSAYRGMIYGNNAAKLISKPQEAGDVDNYDEAEKLLKLAKKLDRLNCAYRMDYIQLLNSRMKSTGDKTLWGEIEENLGEVRKYEPYNSDYLGVILNILLQNGRLKDAVNAIDNAIIREPLNMSLYQTKIDVNYQIADLLIKNKEKKEAIYYLDNMIEVEEELEAAGERSTKKIEIPEKIPPMIGLARNWKLNAEKSLKASGGN